MTIHKSFKSLKRDGIAILILDLVVLMKSIANLGEVIIYILILAVMKMEVILGLYVGIYGLSLYKVIGILGLARYKIEQ